MTVLFNTLIAGASLSGLALAMTLRNLGLYTKPDAAPATGADTTLLSVCIPARNEQPNLRACVESILASTDVSLEVLVYDDQSTDLTPAVLDELAARHPRVRRVPTVPLPQGWNGKQHACARMAAAARGPWLVFTDADVRLEPSCLSRALAFATRRNAALVSTFPRQIMNSPGEALLVPMISFILLTYLPFERMRTTTDPAASAGCGQFLMVRHDAYATSGGHESFRASMHDGIMLPRALRRAGFSTDLFDGVDLLSVRMYHGLTQAWRGFAKNAYEGLGSPVFLAAASLLHFLGHVWPWVALALGALGAIHLDRTNVALADLAIAMNLVHRIVLAVRTEQGAWGLFGAAIHPVAVLAMTAVQWHSFWLHRTGRRTWRGRPAPTLTTT